MTVLDSKKKLIAIVAASALTVGAVAAVIVTEAITRSSTTSPAVPPETPAVSEAAPAAAPAPVHKRTATKARAPVTPVASAGMAPPPPSQSPAFETCTNCGVVQSIESFTEKGPATGGGAVTGGLLGGILGHQIGQGRGKDLATVAGAVGGAIAGNAMEKNANKVTRYHVVVRMNDGSQQLYTLNTAPSLAMNDRVVIVNGVPVRQ